ncbi:hypothetical protein MYSTI_00921 [Myxococcus stipitatus DSM 14675]|uniref:Uncharacterized protein n=1 Tax=Myxococcus stipitatus (strain DSM 14675 / JCM 12634 / Mx s8) TaxID=1278073 RepID=L7U342_MYXSD|nr:hypothetical protein [Myxococcus stipitatus]AGC42270.1 hypothetical protein MYSTI_00921 [Myxococcus stipitatus DSM 14675]
MRRFGMVLGLLGCMGCSVFSRGLSTQYNPETGQYETPTHEVIYLAPLEDAMMTARTLLTEKLRLDVLEREQGTVMFSSFIPDVVPPERYYIKGERLGPRQALVRIFRLRYTHMSGVGTQAADRVSGQAPLMDLRPLADDLKNAPRLEGYEPAVGYRDLSLEQELLARLEMAPALELVSGNPPVSIRSVVMEGDEGAETPAALPPECGARIEGAASLFSAGGVLLVADPLGTKEVPSAMMRMVCEATSQGLPVTLALSIPVSEQPLLERYLQSNGDSTAVQELLTGSAFWRRTYQDGRSSSAMLWLVEQTRRLRASGKDVVLSAIDADKAQGNEREAQLAAHLLAAQAARPQAWTLALTGSVHARTTEVNWDGDLQPMGARVARALPSAVRALDVGFQRGSQFSCRYNVWEDVECNVFGISPTLEARQSSKQAAGLQLFSTPQPHGFQGRLYLGALSASPPALQPQRQVAAKPAAPPAPK